MSSFAKLSAGLSSLAKAALDVPQAHAATHATITATKNLISPRVRR